MQGAPYDQASVTSTLQASGCSVQSSRRQYLAQPLTANVKRARGGTPLGPCTPHTQEAAAVLAGGRWRRSGSARCGSLGALRTWPCLRAQVICPLDPRFCVPYRSCIRAGLCRTAAMR